MLAMSQQNTYYFEVIQAILVLRVQFLTLRNVTSCGEYMKRHISYLKPTTFHSETSSKEDYSLFLTVRSNWLH